MSSLDATDCLESLARACSFVPERTGVAQEAHGLVKRTGAAVLRVEGLADELNDDPDDDAVRQAAIDVVGPELVAAPDVFTVVTLDGDTRVQTHSVLADKLVMLDLHTDGYSYGDDLPDWLFLGCASQAEFGGASIMVDGYAVIDALIDLGGVWAEVVELLTTVPLEQTPAFQTSLPAPTLCETGAGRRVVRRNSYQRLRDGVPAPSGAERLVDRWHALWILLTRAATPFRLEPGDLLCIDNLRVQHGRLPFVGGVRTYQRVWCWSSAALSIPDDLPPVADWEYA